MTGSGNDYRMEVWSYSFNMPPTIFITCWLLIYPHGCILCTFGFLLCKDAERMVTQLAAAEFMEGVLLCSHIH